MAMGHPKRPPTYSQTDSIYRASLLQTSLVRNTMVVVSMPGTAVREQETPDGRFKSRRPLHLILGDSIVEYGSRLFLIYFLLYYCSVRAYFPDESTV